MWSVAQKGVHPDARGSGCLWRRDATRVASRFIRGCATAGHRKLQEVKVPWYSLGLHHTAPVLAVSEADVRANFERYGLLDEQVRFLPGWFKDTLPDAPIDRIAVLRLDGDLYESTIQGLDALYPRLSPGGFCIIDDYNIKGCRQAVTDYRAKHGISAEIVDIDGFGVLWRK